jgi:hypothetical protein
MRRYEEGFKDMEREHISLWAVFIFRGINMLLLSSASFLP